MITALIPLLTLWIHIQQASPSINITLLREAIIADIKLLQTKLSSAAIDQQTITTIIYCFCTALDEAVLNSQTDKLNAWASHPLLSEFHQETWGGERFYHYLEECLQEDACDSLLCHTFYLLLSLGFEGKLYDQPIEREHLQQRLMHKIQCHGGWA